MRRIIAALAGCLAITIGASAQSATCGDAIEVWQIEDRGFRFLTYRPSETTDAGPILFEAYRGDEILWRIEGEYGCSNGIVFCTVSIPTSGADPIEAGETVIFEGDVPQYIVFSDLFQTAAVRQLNWGETIQAEVFDPTAIEAMDGLMRLPSYYRFAGCRPQGEAYD